MDVPLQPLIDHLCMQARCSWCLAQRLIANTYAVLVWLVMRNSMVVTPDIISPGFFHLEVHEIQIPEY